MSSSFSPSITPSLSPSVYPSYYPLVLPSVDPTSNPTFFPSFPPFICPSLTSSFTPSSVHPSLCSTVVLLSDPSSAHPSLLSSSLSPTLIPSNVQSTLPLSLPSLSSSALPSQSPSITPTVNKSISPLAIPTVPPSNQPSNNPSSPPSNPSSLHPSLISTSISTALSSSFSPTLPPTATPSILLPSTPSLITTFISSFLPSLCSTLVPSHLPSISPTRYSTVFPTSTLSTINPSIIPSISPTLPFTSNPIINTPSIIPTRTYTPSTLIPSRRSDATKIPSINPTSRPTLSERSLWITKLNTALSFIASFIPSPSIPSSSISPSLSISPSTESYVTHRSTYFELMLSNYNPSQIYGSCNNWHTFLESELSTSLITYKPKSISFLSIQTLDTYLSNNYNKSIVISCTDSNKTNTIINLLLSTDKNYLSSKHVSCSNHIWKMKWCDNINSNHPFLCIDCSDPCNQDNDCPTNHPYSLSPCISSSSSCPIYDGIKILSLSYTNLDIPPSILNISTIATTTTTINLRIQLDKSGISTCAAFPLYNAHNSFTPTSIDMIIIHGFSAKSDIKNITSILISGLIASTKYHVYCITKSNLHQSTMSLIDSIQHSFYVNTSCCRIIKVSSKQSYLSFSQIITRFLNINIINQPNNDLILSVILKNSSNIIIDASKYFYPSKFIITSFQPFQSIYFSSLSSIPIGSYQYSLEISSPSPLPSSLSSLSKQYTIQYSIPTQSFNSFDVVDFNNNNYNHYHYYQPPIPQLSTAIISDDGSQIIISFDSDTDKASLPTTFPCHQLFTFSCDISSSTLAPSLSPSLSPSSSPSKVLPSSSPRSSSRSPTSSPRSSSRSPSSSPRSSSSPSLSFSSSAMCQWLNNRDISITIISTTSCKVVDDEITLLDNKIKAQCIDNCQSKNNSSSSSNYQHAYYTPSRSIQILSSTNPIYPTVIIKAPDIFSIVCNTFLLLDLTESIGSGGKNWEKIEIKVTSDSSNSFNSIQNLQDFLDTSYTINPPTYISSNYFASNYYYLFSITLCNFLNKCSIGIKNIYVSNRNNIPSLQILGSSIVQNFYRYQELQLISIVDYIECNDDSSSTSSLTSSSDSIVNFQYAWSVLDNNGVINLNYVSISKDPSKFRLPSFLLSSGSTFYVTLTVSSSPSSSSSLSSASVVSASTSIKVNVQLGKIIPVITSGLSKIMHVNETLIIDASQSYDEDIDANILRYDSSNDNHYLIFHWTCLQISPKLSDSCDEIISRKLLSSSTITSSKYYITSHLNIADIEIHLIITDQIASRSSSMTIITVNIQSNNYPIVSINFYSSSSQQQPNQQKFNPQNSLQILGIINLPQSYDETTSTTTTVAIATWSVDDDTGFDLSTSATTAISVNLSSPSSIPSASNYNLYLVLLPNSLPVGVTLNFKLKVTLLNHNSSPPLSQLSSSSILTVIVNTPPSSGTFQVIPSYGQELSQLFLFFATQWYDIDLPLQYQFKYKLTSSSSASSSLSDTVVLLWLRSPTTSRSSILPAGNIYNNYQLPCIVEIYDSLLSSTLSSFNAIVNPNQQFLSSQSNNYSDSYSQYIIKNITKFYNSPDNLKQITAWSAYLLNHVDCSKAPNCRLLNRYPCYRTVNTCGECLSSSSSISSLSTTLYIGDSGDSNTLCYSIEQQQQNNLKKSSYKNKFDYGHRLLLGSNIRMVEGTLKTCNLNCSNHGQCKYVNINSGNEISSCYSNDYLCKAICLCDDNYFGNNFCTLTTYEYKKKQEIRFLLISSIQHLITLEDPDLDTIIGWISLLQLSAQVADELSIESILLLYDAVDKILNYIQVMHNDINIQYLQPLLLVIDNGANNIYIHNDTTTTSNNRYLLSSSLGSSLSTLSSSLSSTTTNNQQLHPNSTLSLLQESLTKYIQILNSNSLPGEKASRFIYNNFRIFTNKISRTSYNSNHNKYMMISLPLSNIEIYFNKKSTSIILPLTDDNVIKNYDYLTVSLTSIRAEYYNKQYQLHSIAEQLYSNPLYLELSESNTDINGFLCSPSSSSSDHNDITNKIYCNFEITLSTSKSLLDLTDHPKYNNSKNNLTCIKGDKSFHSISCPDGTTIDITCDEILSSQSSSSSKTTSLRKYCMFQKYNAVCSSFQGTDISNGESCTVTSVTNESISCSCPYFRSQKRYLRNSNTVTNVTTAHRKMLRDDNNDRNLYSRTYTSKVYQSSANSTIDILIQNKSSSSSSMNRYDYSTGLFFTSSLLLLIILMLMFSIINIYNPSKKIGISNKTKNDNNTIVNIDFIERCLPSIYHTLPLMTRILKEFQCKHPILSLFFSSSSKTSSASLAFLKRSLSLSIKIISLLFSITITYLIIDVNNYGSFKSTIIIVAIIAIVLSSIIFKIIETLFISSYLYIIIINFKCESISSSLSKAMSEVVDDNDNSSGFGRSGNDSNNTSTKNNVNSNNNSLNNSSNNSSNKSAFYSIIVDDHNNFRSSNNSHHSIRNKIETLSSAKHSSSIEGTYSNLINTIYSHVNGLHDRDKMEFYGKWIVLVMMWIRT